MNKYQSKQNLNLKNSINDVGFASQKQSSNSIILSRMATIQKATLLGCAIIAILNYIRYMMNKLGPESR